MPSISEIQNTKFTRSVRGYKEEEVDEFILRVIDDIAELLRENAKLKDKCDMLQVDVDRYREQENLLIETLESAKGLMRDISTSAERRAEIVLKNAELDADRTMREAKESVEIITEDAMDMARRWEQFKARYKNLLQTELERFENMSADLEPDRTGFYSEDPKFTSIADPIPMASTANKDGKDTSHIKKSATKPKKDIHETIKTPKNGE